MAMCSKTVWQAWWVLLLIGHLVGADEVTVRGGAKLRGLVLESKNDSGELRLLTSSGMLPIPRSQVVEVTTQETAGERYQAMRELLKGDDVAGHFELAKWCRLKGLITGAEEELAVVLRLDPQHKDAAQLLAATRRNKPTKRANALVKGPREAASERKRPEPQAQPKVAESNQPSVEVTAARDGDKRSLASQRAGWIREVSRIVGWLESKNPERVRTAREELAAIQDPMAVEALVRALDSAGRDTRERILKTLAAIPGPEATAALALFAATDGSASLREFAAEQLRGRDPRAYRPGLIAALRSRRQGIIFNGADAAGELGELAFVPALITALTTDTKHTFMTAPIVALVPVATGTSRH